MGSGRVASFGPAIDELSQHPFFGRGFGTRIVETSNPKRNSFILDDEWLSTTLEIGLVGLVAWLWIILRFCTRAARGSKTDDDRGWILAALDGVGRCLRRQHAFLRRLQLHPGDSPVHHHPRDRLRVAAGPGG